MTRRSAFTLIELLVVVSIIAVLAGMLLPAISTVRSSARASVCAGGMRQLVMAVVAYSGDNDGLLPPARFQGCAPVEMGFTAGSTVNWYHPSFVGSYIEASREMLGDFIPGLPPFPAPLRCPEDRIRAGSSSFSGVSYGLTPHLSPYANAAADIPDMWKKIRSTSLLRKSSRLLLIAEAEEARSFPYAGAPGVWPNCPLYPPGQTTTWVTYPTPCSTFARHRGGANFAFLDGHMAWSADLTGELASRNYLLGRNWVPDDY